VNQDKNNLTQGPILGKLMGFFFPIMIGLLFQQLYSAVDAAIVGKYIGSAALAAVGGSVAVITNLIIGFFRGVMTGASVLAAQEYGAGDNEKLSRVIHTGVSLCLLIGLTVTGIGIAITPWSLRVTNNPEEIMEMSVTYLRIYYLGSVPLLLFNLGQGVLQAVGDSRRPLIYLVVSCAVNIILDLVFVVLLGWGVAGAAAATVIAMLVCAALVIRTLLRTKEAYRLIPAQLRIHRSDLRRILRIGVPSGVQASMYNISNLIIQVTLNGFGTTVIAAWAATGKLDGFYWVISNAFGLAICSFAGQCYGAGMIDRMKKAIRLCLGIAIGTTVALSVVLLAIARPVYGLILDDTAVIDCAIQIMWYFVPFYFVWSFIEILSGSLRGVGDAFWPMIFTVVGTCVLRIIWVYAVVPIWHTLLGLSIIYVISWAVTATAFIIYYLRGSWLRSGAIKEL